MTKRLLIMTAALFLGTAAQLAGSPSAGAAVNLSCPSSWGFDGTGDGQPTHLLGPNLPYEQEALPGWFGGGTYCSGTGTLDIIVNHATVTDEGTGATVYATQTTPCDGTRSCHTSPFENNPLATGAYFVPSVGHLYRGDYFVTLIAFAPDTWTSWDSRYCSVNSLNAQRLDCDYYTLHYSLTGTQSSAAVPTPLISAPAVSP